MHVYVPTMERPFAGSGGARVLSAPAHRSDHACIIRTFQSQEPWLRLPA